MIRKCLAAQENICKECNYACPKCGVKKWSINEECQLCIDCEQKELKRANISIKDLKNANVVREKNPVIVIFGK